MLKREVGGKQTLLQTADKIEKYKREHVILNSI